MEEMPTKIMLDRAQWAPREVLDVSHTDRSLLCQMDISGSYLMCCLGLMMDQCAVPRAHIDRQRTPKSYALRDPSHYPLWKPVYDRLDRQSPLYFKDPIDELGAFVGSTNLHILMHLNDMQSADHFFVGRPINPELYPIVKDVPFLPGETTVQWKERAIVHVCAKAGVQVEFHGAIRKHAVAIIPQREMKVVEDGTK